MYKALNLIETQNVSFKKEKKYKEIKNKMELWF